MSADRGIRGRELLREVTGEHGERTIRELEAFCPDLADMIVCFAYGDVYARQGLDLKQRMIVTLTALITLGGCEKELRVHIGSALNVGLSAEEIVEVLLHAVPYIGFPKVMNAVGIAREVFAERNVKPA